MAKELLVENGGSMDWHEWSVTMVSAFEMIVGKLVHYTLTAALIGVEVYRLYINDWRFRW